VSSFSIDLLASHFSPAPGIAADTLERWNAAPSGTFVTRQPFL
jgi:hypothetical protein